jgi:hypothetical protein
MNLANREKLVKLQEHMKDAWIFINYCQNKQLGDSMYPIRLRNFEIEADRITIILRDGCFKDFDELRAEHAFIEKLLIYLR